MNLQFASIFTALGYFYFVADDIINLVSSSTCSSIRGYVYDEQLKLKDGSNIVKGEKVSTNFWKTQQYLKTVGATSVSGPYILQNYNSD